MTMTDYAERVKKMRQAAGLRQEDVANLLGYATKGFVSQVECGWREPTLPWLYRYAMILGGNPAELDPRLRPTGCTCTPDRAGKKSGT